VSSLIRVRLYTRASKPPSEFAKLILSWRNQAFALIEGLFRLRDERRSLSKTLGVGGNRI